MHRTVPSAETHRGVSGHRSSFPVLASAAVPAAAPSCLTTGVPSSLPLNPPTPAPSPVSDELATACWTLPPGRAELRSERLPPLPAGHVRVRSLHSAISRGTEGLVLRGEVPASEFERMRAPFQQGEFPGPVKYGYVNVGRVEAGPVALLGQAVFCLHPHQTLYQVPAEAVLPLPPGLPAHRAVLAALMETALNALWDAPPRLGDRITVVGGGTLGLLVAWLAARVPGCTVQVVDTLSERAEVARALGTHFALPEAATPGADLVVHASATAAGLATALRLAGFEATVLELSWYGSRPVPVPLGEAFHSQRLVLKSSQVGSVAPARRARWSHRQRLALALQLLDAPVLERLVTHRSPFAELPQVLAALGRPAADAATDCATDGAAGSAALCHCIDYPAAAPLS